MMEYMTQEQVDQAILSRGVSETALRFQEEQVELKRSTTADSYICLPNFLSQDQVSTLLQRSKDLLADFSLEDHPLTKFTTSDKNHVGDDYFLNSGDKIRYFLEEEAVNENGQLTRDKTKAVNKIGHALHVLDPVFRAVTLGNDKLKAVVRDLKFHHDPVALQSMIIFKQPEIGGAVPEHTDSTFLYTSPPTALGFWIPLERCTPFNGALSFLPGSHLITPITKRFIRKPEGGTGFEEIRPSLPPNLNTNGLPSATRDYVMQTCEPGDLVLIHGSVLHKSQRNTSSQTRYAYTFHMIDGPPHAHYDEKNWLQPTPSMPFTKILDVPNDVTSEVFRMV